MRYDDMPAGTIEVVEEEQRCVVMMRGDVDAGLRDGASAAMVRVLECRKPVVVDVGGVVFIDSSGLAFVLQIHTVAVDEGFGMVLLDPPALLLDLLELIGMGGQVPLTFTPGDGRVRDDDGALVPVTS